MLLKSLELQGFKTFPNRTKLCFNKGVTAVVGPNGSGKSNVSDAIRWVLGEQSNRALRCSKTEDVIFSGTAQKKAHGFAQVTLNVDNTDRTLNFDNDEVSITRRFYRSGESDYLINKTAVRLKDIHEIFMDTGLGRDGYSIIGQGRIDEIISAKPEDRREIFEEAAGISKYKYRKNEAIKRLDKAEENLLRLKDIFGEIQNKMDPLKVESERAKEFLVLSEKKKKLEISIWVDTLERADKTLGEHCKQIDLIKNQITEVEDRLETLNKEYEDSYKKINEHTALVDRIHREISQKEQKILENERDLAILRNNIEHNDSNIKSLSKNISEIKINSEAFAIEKAIKEEELSKLEVEVNNKNDELVALEADFELIDKNLLELTENNKELVTNLNLLNEENSNLRLELASCVSSSKEVHTSVELLNDSMSAIKEKISNIHAKLNEFEQKKSNLANSTLKLENTVQEMRESSQKSWQKIEAIKANVEKFRIESFEKNKKASLLEDLEKNLEGFQKSVKQIIEEKKKGNLSGIHAPLSRIFSIDKKYAVAVEVALGAAMQNIVVDNEQSAKNAIAFLKKHNMGRATFLPLNTIKANSNFTDSDFAREEGFVGVAAQLCNCDQNYRNIINSLLGRVVIATDINTAFSIAKHNNYRFRVVSLDGQVVNAGGSLTGGSQIRNSGLLSRVDDIKTLRNLAKSLEVRCQEELKLLNIEKLNYDKINSNIAKIELNLSESRNKSVELETHISNLLQQVKNEEGSLLEIEGRKQSMEFRLTENKTTQSTIEQKISKNESDISLLKSKLTVYNNNKEDLTTKHISLSQQINEMKLNLVNLKANLKSIGSEILAINSQKIDEDKTINEMQSQITEFEEKNRDYKQKIAENLSTGDFLNSEIDKQKLEINELIQNRNTLEQQIVNLRKYEQSSNSDKEILNRKLASLEEKYNNLKNNYNDIAERLWLDYELSTRQAKEFSEEISNIQETKKQLNMLKSQIKKMGNVNVSAIEEYKELKERYDFMKEQISDIEKSRKELLLLIKDLTSHMKDIFSKNFKKISENFSSTFEELLGGGKASLKLDDSSNVLEAGIEIEVQPKGKLVSRLESLSGGEKALVAISLYFAILKVRPAPFCVLDEIEAALDDINVDRFANYLKKINAKTQFIVITHRRGTMEASDVLYGVTMQNEGISQILSLNLSEAINQVAK